jgi:protein-L-isoaspartate(D-aspartate) O-methyltransferase
MQHPVEMMASTNLPASFAAARQFMVDSQLRPNKVSDPRLLDAMRTIPRGRFLPPHLLPLAYADQDVPLGDGRVLMAPLAFARLAQLLLPVAGERLLVVAGGSGYGAAVLAACDARVVAVDDDEALIAEARSALTALGFPVTLRHGPLREGAPGLDLWDAIFIEGQVAEIPDAIARQLKPGGRLVTVLSRGGNGVAVRAERPRGQAGDALLAGLAIVPAFDCATAVLSAFDFTPHFEL